MAPASGIRFDQQVIRFLIGLRKLAEYTAIQIADRILPAPEHGYTTHGYAMRFPPSLRQQGLLVWAYAAAGLLACGLVHRCARNMLGTRSWWAAGITATYALTVVFAETFSHLDCYIVYAEQGPLYGLRTWNDRKTPLVEFMDVYYRTYTQTVHTLVLGLALWLLFREMFVTPALLLKLRAAARFFAAFSAFVWVGCLEGLDNPQDRTCMSVLNSALHLVLTHGGTVATLWWAMQASHRQFTGARLHDRLEYEEWRRSRKKRALKKFYASLRHEALTGARVGDRRGSVEAELLARRRPLRENAHGEWAGRGEEEEEEEGQVDHYDSENDDEAADIIEAELRRLRKKRM